MSWRQKFTKNLKEISFYFCTKSNGSAGIRKYIIDNYWDLKRLNPMFPFLVRESENIQPVVEALYEGGAKETIDVTDMTPEQIEQSIKKLVEKGETMTRTASSEIDWADIVSYDERELERDY
eukprot:GEZU01002904.1.p1 GENE.GEZU01002904.1~~GEZU01002904.1.p1  ORF type:complete len:134 (+),score=21.86 GEZU01002904.1:37-402(+)